MVETLLQGNIINAPLTIEDQETHQLIKKSNLYIHCSHDDSTNLVSITALIPEGTFHSTLTKEQRLNARKTKENYRNDNVWEDIIIALLNDSYRKGDLVVTGKYLTSSSNYVDGELVEEDEEGDSVKTESLIIDIKTASKKLPITVASFSVPLLDEDEMAGKEETNILNWLDLLVVNGKRDRQRLVDLEEENSKLVKERDYYRQEVISGATEHNEIIKDIEIKFYKVLNSKKDKIWELEKEAIKREKGAEEGNNGIPDLNEKYVEENEFSLSKDAIDLTTVPDKLRDELIKKTKPKKKAETKRPKREKASQAAKKRKLEVDDSDSDVIEAGEAEENGAEYNDENRTSDQNEIEGEEVASDQAADSNEDIQVKLEDDSEDLGIKTEEEEEVQDDPIQSGNQAAELNDGAVSDENKVKVERDSEIGVPENGNTSSSSTPPALSYNELERIQREKQKNRFKLRMYSKKNGNNSGEEESGGKSQESASASAYSIRHLSDRDLLEEEEDEDAQMEEEVDEDTEIDSDEEDEDDDEVEVENKDIGGFVDESEPDSVSKQSNENSDSNTRSVISDSLKS